LSYGAWQSRFGGDPQVVGRAITLNGRPHVVIGVTAAEFRDAFGPTEVWLPITSAPNPTWFTRGQTNVWAIGRLKPGVSFAQAQRDLSGVAAQLAAEYPDADGGADAYVTSLRDNLVGTVRPILVIVLAFVGVVLLIACANVANLQLARAASRRREMSVRAALGADRPRLVRQLLTESLALAVLGGVLGVALAYWGIQGLLAAAPDNLPALGPIGLNIGVLVFCAGLTLAAGLLFGTAPALHGSRENLGAALTLRSADGSGGRRDLRQVFVALQLALSVVLLVGAGLLTRSLAALQRVDPGFNTAHLLTAEFRLPAVKYATPKRIGQFMTSALTAIRAVPGVTSAGFIRSMPLSGNWGGIQYAAESQSGLNTATAPAAQQNSISDGLFATMGMRLRAGRDFDAHDRSDAPPVAIVNEELARRSWPGHSAVGQRLRLLGPPDTWVTVVGVVDDIKQLTLGEPPTPQIYQPMLQAPGIFNTVAARTDGDPASFVNAVRAAIWSVDPDQPVWKLRSMESLVASDLAGPRFTMLLTLAFALLAMLLAAVGVYGVMSYTVVQRTREVGIRMALGARRAEVVRLVLGRGLAVVAIALVIGLAAALGLAPLIRTQLFDVPAADPVTFIAAPVLLVAVALLACYLPARRAARVDPMVALRTE
jgi:putative ABC transport system permease protein